MTDADEYVHDDDLLIEAARYAILEKRQSRNLFLKRASDCWYKAAREKGLDPHTLKKMGE